MRFALVLCISCGVGWSQEHTTLVDRVGTTGFLQLEADSFRELTPRQQELAFWLTGAATAIHPIIFDQMSRFGLREKLLLEAVVANPHGVDPAVYAKVLAFTKLFWANRGNHNETTAQKFLPEFTFDELKAALLAVSRGGYRTGLSPQDVEELRRPLFDPDFEPMATAKSPRGGLDILQASANNFYVDVSLVDLKNFTEHYPLNSRLEKVDGKLVEHVYRAGTPHGRITPGLYAEYLANANLFLEKAAAVAEPQQAKAIRDLIRFYQTGDPKDWLTFGTNWVQNNPRVDFDSGFIEVYRDARGAKGSSQSFVTVVDERLNALMQKLAQNAQYFENKAPWAPQYRNQGVKPPLAKAVETLIETGDFHVTTVGDNLPNENEIHENYGSKSFLFTGSSRALALAAGNGSLTEFAYSPEEIEIGRKYGIEADDLLTALHEIIGHGSGRMNPKLTGDPASYLKEYYSTLEEARADLMALWNVWDPKLQELGLISNPDVAKAMYYSAARVALTQLRRIPKGDTIEEDHERGRQLIAFYIMDKTGGIEKRERGGKTCITVTDFDKMRKGVGMLLGELMRIKAEGDYAAIKALIDKYGVHFDPALRDQAVARYQKLNIPTYWVGINPDLRATFGPKGEVLKVDISYPRDYVKQQLAYSSMFRTAN